MTSGANENNTLQYPYFVIISQKKNLPDTVSVLIGHTVFLCAHLFTPSLQEKKEKQFKQKEWQKKKREEKKCERKDTQYLVL